MECRTFSAMMIGPRLRQEDCLLDGCELFQTDMLRRKNRFSANQILLAVCDGMGGHAGGQRASRFACEQIRNVDWSGGISGQKIQQMLLDIQTRAERQLPRQSGTTIAGLLSDGDKSVIFNAGDSRVYKLTSESIEYLSHDHSLVQDLIDQSMMNVESAGTHPLKHLIDFGIGPAFSHVWSMRNAYIFEEHLYPGTHYLLCTDGLTDILTDHDIYKLLAPAPIENGARLANEIRKRGLTDNASFVIARIA